MLRLVVARLFIARSVKSNYFKYFSLSDADTEGCTYLLVSPLCLAISLTILEDKKLYSSAGLIKTLSIDGSIDGLIGHSLDCLTETKMQWNVLLLFLL